MRHSLYKKHIRTDITFPQTCIDFLDEIFTEYNNRQLVIEMKNVKEISRDHINQLNRYMQNNIGNFGVFLTRNPLSKAISIICFSISSIVIAG